MRLLVRLQNPVQTLIPLSHQDLLAGVIYHLLATSNADYSRFLHDEGYAAPDESGRDDRRFKLFVFSGLRSRQRRVVGDQLALSPGPVEWQLGAPVEDFLRHCATGLLSAGELRLRDSVFPIESVQTLPAPDFSSGTFRGACLSPIVASVPRPDSRYPLYLRPSDGALFSHAIHQNLSRKHQVLYGRPAEGEPVRLTFDPAYLEKHRGGTKLIRYHNIEIVGALAPFTASGAPALLEVGYECGFGEKNSGGFGMVEVR